MNAINHTFSFEGNGPQNTVMQFQHHAELLQISLNRNGILLLPQPAQPSQVTPVVEPMLLVAANNRRR